MSTLDERHLIAALNALDPPSPTALGRTERVARAIASAESDALARLARLESDLEEIAARLGYMPLDSEPRTAYELLRLNVDKLERDLQHEIAEHQRHHDMESQMGPLLFHLHEAARLWREYRRTDTEWDWGPVTAWHEQDAQLNPELAVKK